VNGADFAHGFIARRTECRHGQIDIRQILSSRRPPGASLKSSASMAPPMSTASAIKIRLAVIPHTLLRSPKSPVLSARRNVRHDL
jgi:hypothetical protein